MDADLQSVATHRDTGDSDRDIVHERSPLLKTSTSQTRSDDSGSRKNANIYLLLAIIAGLDFTMFMLSLPLTRVYEGITCYDYYAAHDPGRFIDPASIPEALCKIEIVQEELAVIKGYEMLFMSLPGVLLSLPYGILGDRWGRKPVLLLCVSGLALSLTALLVVCWFWWIFPLHLVWLAWSLTAIGGGATTMVSTVFSMLTDLTSPEERAPIFLQLTMAIWLAQAIATSLASFMMSRLGTTVPVAVAYVVGLSSCALAALVVETRHVGSDTDGFDNDSQSTADSSTGPKKQTFVLAGRIARTVASFGPLLQAPSLVALILSFVVNTIGTSSINIIIQYASKRFAVPISNVGFLLTIRAAFTILVFVAILPSLGRFLKHRYTLDGPSRDLWLARLTVLCVPLGFLIITLGSNVTFMSIGTILTALGSGCGTLLRSVATGMVSTDLTARLHGTITLVDTIGVLLSGPLLAETFASGLRMGGGWIALPFILATVLTSLGSAITWLVRLPKAAPSDEIPR